jgi:chorismate dehydratase
VIRIGGVPFGVGRPLLAGLESAPGVQLTRAVPTQLVEGLRQGRLDAALVSSIEAVRQPGYRVVPGLGIACREEIRSVRAFRRRGSPVRSVGLDASSATSVTLLRILLAGPRRSEVAPDCTFETIRPTRRPDDLPQDLVLLIGDDGLAAEAGTREVWDLGREWRRWTGLPFVFAVWLLAPGADAARITPLLQRAHEVGSRTGSGDGTEGAAHYVLDDNDIRGLRRFWHEARQAGLAGPGAEPGFAGSEAEGHSR